MFQKVQKLVFVLIAVAALVVSSGVPVIADQPTALYNTICFDANDPNQLAVERAECDAEAQDEGFKHGFLRPCQTDPRAEVPCDSLCKRDVYTCFGVGPQP